MKKLLERLSRLGKMTFAFTILSFVVLTITIISGAVIVGVIYHLGILEHVKSRWVPFIALCSSSIIFGVILSLVLARKPLKPFNELLNGLEELSKGNYKVRMKNMPGGPEGYGKQLEERFNKLAEELDHTEMLRGDFVNNFSHEFKTPIVSIRGFAKLIQKGKLEPTEQEEYLNIIVEESTRLSDMATNVLALTKLENQTILQGVEAYNLSEQLRTCILLLEKKWTSKDLMIEADFPEYRIIANEEMMKQVWINLLENAIKFCNEQGTVSIHIEELNGKEINTREKNAREINTREINTKESNMEETDKLLVSIGNTGSSISEEDKKRIFRKFYQADTSHAAAGNGIGLAIVKRVLDLHGDEIAVDTDETGTSFRIIIPVNTIKST